MDILILRELNRAIKNLVKRGERSWAGHDQKFRGFSGSQRRSICLTLNNLYLPLYSEYTMSHKDRIILIASDGVWEFLSNDEIIAILSPFY